MAGLAELATVMMASAQRRIEVTASNISNINTPGFRSQKVFQQVLDERQTAPVTTLAIPRRTDQPAFKQTGNPLDLAVSGSASLLLRAGDRLIGVSSAQLRRDSEGRLADSLGRILQAAGGGDIVISANNPVILKDGTMLVGGQPEARVGMFASTSEVGGEGNVDHGISAGSLPDIADDAVLHQGMVVPSDVDLASEMVDLTHAGRTAETGAKLFQIYDDLLGRVATKMGEIGQ
jgi:flagellar basal-body rod protein FlgF